MVKRQGTTLIQFYSTTLFSVVNWREWKRTILSPQQFFVFEGEGLTNKIWTIFRLSLFPDLDKVQIKIRLYLLQ